jgi:cytochrome c biogenesis protein CcdA
MKILKQIFMIILFVGFATIANAQNGSNESTVGEFMRSNQRSYVVIAVMLTILLGIVLYLVRLERKISKLERENKQ